VIAEHKNRYPDFALEIISFAADLHHLAILGGWADLYEPTEERRSGKRVPQDLEESGIRYKARSQVRALDFYSCAPISSDSCKTSHTEKRDDNLHGRATVRGGKGAATRTVGS
jgi:hypothetical protein